MCRIYEEPCCYRKRWGKKRGREEKILSNRNFYENPPLTPFLFPPLFFDPAAPILFTPCTIFGIGRREKNVPKVREFVGRIDWAQFFLLLLLLFPSNTLRQSRGGSQVGLLLPSFSSLSGEGVAFAFKVLLRRRRKRRRGDIAAKLFLSPLSVFRRS